MGCYGMTGRPGFQGPLYPGGPWHIPCDAGYICAAAIPSRSPLCAYETIPAKSRNHGPDFGAAPPLVGMLVPR